MRAALAALPRFQKLAESRMLSRATIRRKTGNMTTAANGLQVPEWQVVRTDLPVRIAGTAARTPPKHRAVNVTGVEISEATRVLHFPASSTDLRDGDYVEITAGENAENVYEIDEADGQDQATGRRVPATAVDRPGEW